MYLSSTRKIGCSQGNNVERRIGASTAAGELRLDDFELILGTAPGIIKIDVDGCEIDVP
jgi:hypothetical protein